MQTHSVKVPGCLRFFPLLVNFLGSAKSSMSSAWAVVISSVRLWVLFLLVFKYVYPPSDKLIDEVVDGRL